MNFSQESDMSESSSNTSFLELDDFISSHLDELLDIYDDLKWRFALSPNFLEYLKSTTFVQTTAQNVLTPSSESQEDNSPLTNVTYFKFLEEYHQELEVSHEIINNFLRQFRTTISSDTWARFCFQWSYTDDL